MSLAIYADEGCKEKVSSLSFPDQYIEYLSGEGKKKLFNVVPIGQTAKTDIYLRNEGQNDVAVINLRPTDNQIRLKVFESGYLRTGDVFKIEVAYTPEGAGELRGNIAITYHEILR